MAAVPSDLNALLEASKCFTCYEPGQREYVNTYLLAVIAGVGTDPQVLLEAAECFECLEPGQLQYVNTYLRWIIAGSP